LLCMTILLFFFLPPRIFSLGSHAYHASYFSCLITFSFYFISVPDNSMIFLS
jgi:hypothetical protein